jgi:hypothetical protein
LGHQDEKLVQGSDTISAIPNKFQSKVSKAPEARNIADSWEVFIVNSTVTFAHRPLVLNITVIRYQPF